MPLETITIGGQPISPGQIIMQGSIVHGLSAPTDGPTASSASLALLIPETIPMPTWAVGDTIQITADSGITRFTGVVTDLQLSHEQHPDGDVNTIYGLLEVTAAGALAQLGNVTVGGEPWPAESDTARAKRILAMSGLPSYVQGGPKTAVLARAAEPQSALDLLTELAESCGAAIFDTPGGSIVYQAWSARAQTIQWTRWSDLGSITWDQWPDTWQDMTIVSPAAQLPLEVDPGAIDWAPRWACTSAEIVNDVTIGYGVIPEGGEQATVSLTDGESITRFGLRHYGSDTILADAASAVERSGLIVARQAWPRWALAGIDIPDPETDPQILELMCGARISIDGLPQPAPQREAVLVVEGWTHTYSPNLNMLTLATSDPMMTMAGITWSALDPTKLWVDLLPDAIWGQAITHEDLFGEAA